LVAVGILIAVVAVFLYLKFKDKFSLERRRANLRGRWWEELDLGQEKRARIKKRVVKRKIKKKKKVRSTG
jgi:hypothetical protein